MLAQFKEIAKTSNVTVIPIKTSQPKSPLVVSSYSIQITHSHIV